MRPTEPIDPAISALPKRAANDDHHLVPLTYMTVPQYAEYRQVSERTVWGWIRRGVPSIKQGGTRRIRPDVADAWIDAGNLNRKRAKRTNARRPK